LDLLNKMATLSKIDKYVSREFQIIAVVVGILGTFYAMVLLPIQRQTQELEVIKNNHLNHIEQEITEIRKKQSDRDLCDAERDKKIERILVILEKL